MQAPHDPLARGNTLAYSQDPQVLPAVEPDTDLELEGHPTPGPPKIASTSGSVMPSLTRARFSGVTGSCSRRARPRATPPATAAAVSHTSQKAHDLPMAPSTLAVALPGHPRTLPSLGCQRRPRPHR